MFVALAAFSFYVLSKRLKCEHRGGLSKIRHYNGPQRC